MKILLRILDIAENMNWDLMDKCENLFDQYNIKPLMGVIPHNQDLTLKSFPKRDNFWKIIKLTRKRMGNFYAWLQPSL